MTEPKPKPTIGRAIDEIVDTLRTFEERDQKTILGTVCAHLDISPPLSAVPVPTAQPMSPAISNPPHTSVPTPESKGPHRPIDIRALKEQKKPSSARQMACLVAYYLQEHAPESERKQSIGTADVEKYFKQAGFRLPEKIEQLLGDSKRSGYFETQSRGEYRLTRVGYNLVAHSMPAKVEA